MPQGLLSMIPVTAGNLVLFVASMVIMLFLSPLLTLVALLVGPALYFVALASRRRLFPSSWYAQQQSGAVAGVVEAAVTGVPHRVLGEDVAAWVVPRAGSELDRDELLAFVAERLADYKRPHQLHIVDDLPRNATGKVMKHRLEVPSSP